MGLAFDIEERNFPSYSAISIRTRDSLAAMGKMIGRLYGRAREAGRKSAGPVFCVYYEKPVDPQSVDYEMFLPLSGEADAAKGIAKIGGENCVYLRVKGAYSQFESAYEALSNFMTARKLEMIAPPREVYVRGPLFGFLTFFPIMVTDIYFPIAGASR